MWPLKYYGINRSSIRNLLSSTTLFGGYKNIHSLNIARAISWRRPSGSVAPVYKRSELAELAAKEVSVVGDLSNCSCLSPVSVKSINQMKYWLNIFIIITAFQYKKHLFHWLHKPKLCNMHSASVSKYRIGRLISNRNLNWRLFRFLTLFGWKSINISVEAEVQLFAKN